MIEVKVSDAALQQAAQTGMDEFIGVFIDAILDAIGGELTAQNIGQLNAEQVTLLAYHYLHEEVTDGGFVQLIHNGYGPFLFQNPFAKALRLWDMRGLSNLMNKVRKQYLRYHEEIEQECTDEEFMALFESHPIFDDYDDEFIENEELFTSQVAHYVDAHIERFATIV